jgi:hypothetical protein
VAVVTITRGIRRGARPRSINGLPEEDGEAMSNGESDPKRRRANGMCDVQWRGHAFYHRMTCRMLGLTFYLFICIKLQ